jgi:hypothetical protein
MSLTTGDLIRLGCVSFLGVFSYAIAAWGLMHTSVIHYAFIYGLLPSCTAMLSYSSERPDDRGPNVQAPCSRWRAVSLPFRG